MNLFDFAQTVTAVLSDALNKGQSVFICGNGGSYEMADHFAGELLPHGIKVFPLNSGSAITAIANDFTFNEVFSRQLKSLGRPGDILITLSTSGTSKNILEAQKMAKRLGITPIPFPTKKELSASTGQTQEAHLQIIHDVTDSLIEELK